MSKAKAKVHYTPPIPFERLQAMIAALESEVEIDRAARDEMASALDCLFMTLAMEEESRTPGRRKAFVMQFAAYRVHCLVERHNAYVNSAVNAVLIDGADPKVAENLKSTYRKMKAAGRFKQFIGVDEARLALDAARLPLTRRRHKKAETNGG